MELTAARDLALTLMAEHGISDTWTFAFDNATRRMGLCNYRKHTISVSRHFAEHASEAQVRDTILHEIAHALTPGAKHGPGWKVVALRIGATPKACGENPFMHSEGEVGKLLAKVDGKPFYRVASPRFANKRYRILSDNEKTYSLVDEEGGTLRAAKSLVYPDGQPQPTPAQMREAERQRNLAAVAGKPVVRISVPGYDGRRYAILRGGRHARENHTLVNLDTGQPIKVAQRLVRPESPSELVSHMLA